MFAAAMAGEPEAEPLPDAGLAVVPFGVPQLVWKHPVRGMVYALTQAGAAGVGVWGGVEHAAAVDAGDEAAVERWQNVMGVSVGAAALSYAVQVVDGSRLAEERARQAAESAARREAVQRFDAALALAVPRAQP